MKKIFTYILFLAGLMACSNEDNISNDQQPAAQAKVYHVCIPASMGDDTQTRAMSFDNTTCTSTFATTEKVYVYNKSKSTMLGNYLSPSNLSNDNKNCDLTGDLTGTFSEGDELWLLYNADEDGDYRYYSQNGLETGVKDGAKAVVTVSTTSPFTTSFAHFTNLQSMFRFKFVDEGSNPISVASLTIFNTNNAVCRSYYGTSGGSELGKIYVTPSSATSDYLYVGIRFYSAAHDGNKMVFIASDGTNLYRARKAEPAAGFENGKYYYSTNPIQLTNEGALHEPTITWITPSSPVALYDNDYYDLNVDNAEISVTGTSFGYRFLLTDYDTPATIHLNGITATRFEEDFIKSYYNSATLDITGTNSITCDDADRCVSASQNLKLSGDGTLTVTCKNGSSCGLYGGSNYNSSNNAYATTTVLDVSAQLAADGYTVTRSARTDNLDGTYTWTYTVAPIKTLSEATTSDYGKVVCAVGHLHNAKTAVPNGCTAVGILGKVSETGHGLILALQDATSQTWYTINGWASVTTYAGTTLKVLPDNTARGSLTSYATLGSITVSNWAVAQKSDYEAIFVNLGSTAGDSDGTTYDANVNDFITAGLDGTALSGYYCSATEANATKAWFFYDEWWYRDPMESSQRVRPVLGF
ncbi:MAG: hypothetical protein J5502_11065 [Prevotella sp.]|nr:hypothetical protein [Prevotella sp.]